MDELGLSALTDDQLVELVAAISTEMANRHPDTLDAAKRAIQDRMAAAKRSEEQIWTLRKWLASQVASRFGSGWWLFVEPHHTGRTLIQFERRGGSRSKSTSYSYYPTGGWNQPPGAFTTHRTDQVNQPDGLARVICNLALETFPDGLDLDCDAAIQTPYPVGPDAQSVSRYETYLTEHENWERAKSALWRTWRRNEADALTHTEKQCLAELCAVRGWADHALTRAETVARKQAGLPTQQPDETDPDVIAIRAPLNASRAKYDQVVRQWICDNPEPQEPSL